MKIKNAKKYLAVALTAATLVTGVGFDSPTISYADTIEDSSSVNNEAVTGTDLFEKLVVSDGWQDDWAFDCKNVLYASNTPVKKVNKNFNLYKDNRYAVVFLTQKKANCQYDVDAGDYGLSGQKFDKTISAGNTTIDGETWYYYYFDFSTSYVDSYKLVASADTEMYIGLVSDKPTPENKIAESAPSVKDIKMKKNSMQRREYYAYTAFDCKLSSYPKDAEAVEWQTIDAKTKKVSATGETRSKEMGFHVNKGGVYKLQVRTRNTNSEGNKVYSDWKTIKTFITEPPYNLAKCKGTDHTFTYAFKSVPNATSYRIYMKSNKEKKYTFIKTVKKAGKVKITKYKGKKLDLNKNTYYVSVKAVTKVDGKTIVSTNDDYINNY